MLKKRVRWVAQLTHVREISLLGTASLAFWGEQLEKEDLVPAENDGKALILIVAAESRYRGVRFRELSFSVLVYHQEQGIQRDGAYLTGAFNSCRFFAFSERVLFSTPYHYGDVRLSTSFPPYIELLQGENVIFRAAMQADARELIGEPARIGEDGWEGAVFLPERRRKDRQRKLFFARMCGHTRAYPFVDSQDTLTIRPPHGSAVLQALIDSHFAGKEWAVREDATHAKSKTYNRAEAFAA